MNRTTNNAMNSNRVTDNRTGLNKPASVVSAVTMDKSQWAQKTKYQWIFWMALLMSAALLLGSCKNRTASSQVNGADTAGLAAFNAQKAADSAAALNVAAPAAAGAAMAAHRGQYREGSGAVKSINDQGGSANNADDNSAGASADQPTETETSNTASTTTTTKKKKFSSAAKGALIGAGSGAVVGAIVAKKNRGLGAVIGAAVGGGAGYGIGKHKDNKQKEAGQ